MASSACHRKPRASRARSRAPSSWVNSKGFVAIVVASLLARLAARLLSFLAPLVLLLGLLGLAALRGRVAHTLAFLPSKIAPTASAPEAKLVAISNNSFESTGELRPSSRTRSRHVVPSRKACTISD
jgi:NhaP-type Na+/H+ or K+/H+ antiporter